MPQCPQVDAPPGKRASGALLKRATTPREDGRGAIEPTIGPSRTEVLTINDRWGREHSSASFTPGNKHTTHNIHSDTHGDLHSDTNNTHMHTQPHMSIHAAISPTSNTYMKHKRSEQSGAARSTGRAAKRSKHTTSNGQRASGGSEDVQDVAKALADTQTDQPYGVREAGSASASIKGIRSHGDSSQPSRRRTVHTGSGQRPPHPHEERPKSKPILLKRPHAFTEKSIIVIDEGSGSEEESTTATRATSMSPLLTNGRQAEAQPSATALVHMHAIRAETPRTATTAPGTERATENTRAHQRLRTEQQATTPDSCVEQSATAQTTQSTAVDGRAWLNDSIDAVVQADVRNSPASDSIDEAKNDSASEPAIHTADNANEVSAAAESEPVYAIADDIRSAKAFVNVLRNRKSQAPATDPHSSTTIKEGRKAFARLLDAPATHLRDFASDCLEVVEGIQFATPRHIDLKRPIGDRHLLQAISLAIKVVRAAPSTIERAMLVSMRALLADPSKALAKRARFGVRCLIDEHGLLGHAAFKVVADRLSTAGGGHAQGVMPAIAEWHRLADKKLERLPLPASDWLDAMRHQHENALLATSDTDSIDAAKGIAAWMPALGSAPDSTTPPHVGGLRAVTWNANSFFKRLRGGRFAAMLIDYPDLDVIHITELRKAIKPNDDIELSGTLRALGFTHILWNWCNNEPGNYGSAILSKRPFTATIGLDETGDVDPEGRTITTHFSSFSIVWTYTPCSSMFGRLRERDDRRRNYDARFLAHCKRVKAKANALFVCGDMNVAPCWGDTTVPAEQAEWYPSNKPFERDAYFKLLKECELQNMAEALDPQRDPDRTWQKGTPGATNYIAMRLDHVLGPACTPSTDATHDSFAANSTQQHSTQAQPAVTALEVGSNTYGSDHFPVFFTITDAADRTRAVHVSSASAAVQADTCCNATPAPRAHHTIDSMVLDAIRRLQAKTDGPCSLSTFRPKDFALPTFQASACTARAFSNCVHEIMKIEPVEEDKPTASMHACATLAATTTQHKRACEGAHARGRSHQQSRAYPEYTPYRGHGLPHEHRKIVPEVRLLFNTLEESKRANVETMWDTGACYNIMTVGLAKRLGLHINREQQLPLLTLADGAITSPLGSTSALVHFGRGIAMKVQFFVFEGAPHEAIFGSDFMLTTDTKIAFANRTIDLTVGTLGTTSLSFKPTIAAKLSTAAAMHVAEPFIIPANTEMKLPVRFAYPRRDIPSQWGIVEDSEMHSCKVARGITCAMKGLAQNYGYHCKVINASDRPVRIEKDKPIAFFRPIDTNEYSIISSDGLGEDIASSANSSPSNVSATASSASAPKSTAAINKEWVSHPHLADLDLSIAKKELRQPQYDMLRMIILKHHELWDTRPKEPPEEADVCSIQLEGEFNHFVRTRPMAPNERAQLREIVQGQLMKRIIEPSKAPYASAVILVPKKGGGVRFCVDYRALNSKVRADSWTLPNVEESMTSLHGNSWFTSLDMKEAFWSVPLHPE